MSRLVSPYGGELRNLVAPAHEREQLWQRARELKKIQLDQRSLCDLEMLAVGAFSPLDRFMGEADFSSVLESMRLADGTLFPLPVTLPVPNDAQTERGNEVALVDAKNDPLAILEIEEIYAPDRAFEAKHAYGTNSVRHPVVAEMNAWGTRNVSGKLKVFSLPRHYDFAALRLSPVETRHLLEQFGHADVIAFQTRNPIHRVHEELAKKALEKVGGSLLIHPVVGMTKPGDVDHFTRVRSYKLLVEKYFDLSRTLLALLPLAMHLAGPRSAILHALIRRNYGANHLIVGRDHASPGVDVDGSPFYEAFEAQHLLEKYSEELGVTPVFFEETVYVPSKNRYVEVSEITSEEYLSLSGTQVREDYLFKGVALPEWFTRPEVAAILRQSHPPKHRQGFCVWFTGLSGAGKSTTAELLALRLAEQGRHASVLDGDVVRTHLSKGLGFSKEDRDTNIRRIGFVASEIVKHGGVVICAAVSPYVATRNECRAMIGADNFIEVFVDTPIEICEKRDSKGMYALARKGEIKNFTGIDDPYEVPTEAEITLNSETNSAEENADVIIRYLAERGLIRLKEYVNNAFASD